MAFNLNYIILGKKNEFIGPDNTTKTRIPFELRIKGITAGIRTPVTCPIPGPFLVVWRVGYCD